MGNKKSVVPEDHNMRTKKESEKPSSSYTNYPKTEVPHNRMLELYKTYGINTDPVLVREETKVDLSINKEMPPGLYYSGAHAQGQCQCQHDKEDEENPRFRDALVEDLNISGVKQVFGRTGNCIRRFLWLTVLASMAVMMGVTIYIRVVYYFSYPTSVRTHTVTSQRIRFPTVTICNLNPVRASGAYDADQNPTLPQRTNAVNVYGAITEFFNVLDNLSDESVDEYINEYSKVWDNCEICHNDSFYSFTKHYKETFIHSCEWRGRPCAADNFTEVYTDLGVCYQFNDGSDGKYIHHAEYAGADGGLRLVLNVEQYEYMRSRREIAGAYGMVHDQDEEHALVKGKGFSISKGTYTSINMDRWEYINLPGPSASCTELGKAKSKCLLNCLSAYIISECGCKDIYMTGNAEYCDVEQYLHCLYPKKRDFISLTNYTSYCGQCKHSCNRTRYEIGVGLSPLSDFYAKRMSKELQADFQLVQDYMEATRLQDWATLYQINVEYTDWIFNMSFPAVDIYNVTTDGLEASLEPLYNLDSEIQSVLQNDTEAITKWNYIYGHAEVINMLSNDASNFSIYHYLFNYMFDVDRRAEEINVRLAHDFVAVTNETSVFIDVLEEYTHLMEDNATSLTNLWQVFIISNITIDSKQRTRWNDTVYKSMVEINQFLAFLDVRLKTFESMRYSLAKWLSRDPKVGDPPEYTDVGEIDFFLQNFARLDIYYDELNYITYIEVKSYDMAALICDLGGNLGLFLGGSLLTVVELMDIIVMHTLYVACCCCICDSISRRAKKRRAKRRMKKYP